MPPTDPSPRPAAQTRFELMREMWLSGFCACWRDLHQASEDPPPVVYNAAFERWSRAEL